MVVEAVGGELADVAAPGGLSEFAVFLRGLREARNISQRRLADEVGIHYTSISRWERHPEGKRVRADSRDTIERIDRVLRGEGRLLELAGLDARPDVSMVRRRPPFRDLILSEPTLDRRAKQMLLASYEALRKPASPSEDSSG